MLWFISLAGLVLACVASTGARALSDFSRHDLEELCRKRNRPERLSLVLRSYRRASIAAELAEILLVILVIGINAVAWAGVWNALRDMQIDSLWKKMILTPAGAILGVLFASVFVPRAVSHLWATPVVYYGWPLWRFFDRLLSPLLILSQTTEIVLRRAAGIPAPSESEDQFEEEIRTLVSTGEREGFLEEEAREMIEGVMKLSDVTVSEIMTPRTEMVCLPSEASWEDVLQTIIREGHTRIPVYEETRDNIIGILYVKDLLPYLAESQTESRPAWTSVLREPFFVPETKSVHDLMQEFQKTRNHLAVVLDEYGGVSGIITLEDILEEIVGEIADELDSETVEEIVVLEGGRADVRGTARVEEINRRLGLRLPEDEEYDTIAGLIMTHLGRVPPVGETISVGDVRLTVTEGDRRRIRRVLIESMPQTESPRPAEDVSQDAGVSS